MKLLQGYLHSLPSYGFSSHVNYLATFHFNPPLSFSTKEIIWFLHWRHSVDSCPLSRKQDVFVGFTCACYFSFFFSPFEVHTASYFSSVVFRNFQVCEQAAVCSCAEKFRRPEFFPWLLQECIWLIRKRTGGRLIHLQFAGGTGVKKNHNVFMTPTWANRNSQWWSLFFCCCIGFCLVNPAILSYFPETLGRL